MENKKTGIVIKVKNLTSCKAFYRDILELGNPVLDSNFRVEFQCGSSFFLILEKTPWDEPLQPASDRIIWLYQAADAKTVWSKMISYGFPVPELSEMVANGERLCRFADPEGNPFYVPSGIPETTSRRG
jgi:catechol 2,3-dioxygenase-like lactoylglutathione lyase family enzyme